MVIRCPRCNRFLCEVDGYARAICQKCHVQVIIQQPAPTTLTMDKPLS